MALGLGGRRGQRVQGDSNRGLGLRRLGDGAPPGWGGGRRPWGAGQGGATDWP